VAAPRAHGTTTRRVERRLDPRSLAGAATVSAAPVRPTGPERARSSEMTLAALSLAGFLVVFADSAVSVALPALGGELALTRGDLEWVVVFPERQRGIAIGLWSGISAIGLGGGPLLGAMIVEAAGWAGLFLLNVPLGILVIVAALAGNTSTPATGATGRLDVAGAAAAASALFLGLLALSRGNADGWLSAPVLALAFAALVAVVVFVWTERRASDPLAPIGLLRTRLVVGTSVVGLLSTATMCSRFFFVSLYLQSVAGYTRRRRNGRDRRRRNGQKAHRGAGSGTRAQCCDRRRRRSCGVLASPRGGRSATLASGDGPAAMVRRQGLLEAQRLVGTHSRMSAPVTSALQVRRLMGSTTRLWPSRSASRSGSLRSSTSPIWRAACLRLGRLLRRSASSSLDLHSPRPSFRDHD
jgi:hypothetical protein